MNTVRVIGIGNPFVGDDAVGMLVARKLKKHKIPGVDIIEAGLPGLDLLDLLEGMDRGIVIDAVHSGCEEGTILRLEVPQDLGKFSDVTWDSTAPSTHNFGLGEALTLGDILGTLPSSLAVYGIELGHLIQGKPLSPRVSESIDTVVARIMDELGSRTCMNSM